MVLTLILGVALLQSQDKLSPLVCPMTGEAVTASSPAIDYNGVRFQTCCSDCPAAFKKDPKAAIKAARAKGKTFGVFLFDPISHARIDAKKAVASSDYKGIRYLFASAAEKATFDASPKDFTHSAKKEVLYCPVAGHAIKNYASAGGYLDIDGTRYYTCCTNCLAKLKADNSLAKAAPADQVKTPTTQDVAPTNNK